MINIPIDLNTKKLQQAELNIFKVFISVCQELNLKYYILYGTLLGAIRHKGFIPWDDDIDVGMPRSDYKIFVEKAQSLLPKNLFLQTCYTDKNYPIGYAKIRNSDTTFIETTVKNFDMNHGIFIDIFPLDYCETKIVNSKLFNFRKELLDLRFSAIWFSRRKQMKHFFSICLSKLFYPSIAVMNKKRDSLFSSKSSQQLITNFCMNSWKKHTFPRNCYGEGLMVEFEGLSVCAPEQYDLWLTKVYGDYMKLPPKENRNTYHNTEVIDFDRSYKDYLNF